MTDDALSLESDEPSAGDSCRRCGTPLTKERLQILTDYPRQWYPCEGSSCDVVLRWLPGQGLQQRPIGTAFL